MASPEAGPVFMSLQTEFLVAACSDDYIAEILCNRALPVQQDIKARIALSIQQQQQLELQYAAESTLSSMFGSSA